jgi:hypothetical protein
MNKEQAEHELERLLSVFEEPKKILDSLEAAQWHYMDLVGITQGVLLNGTALDKEREEKSHLLRTEIGMPVFDEKECALYMSEKHKLPLQLCAAYVHSEQW